MKLKERLSRLKLIKNIWFNAISAVFIVITVVIAKFSIKDEVYVSLIPIGVFTYISFIGFTIIRRNRLIRNPKHNAVLLLPFFIVTFFLLIIILVFDGKYLDKIGIFPIIGGLGFIYCVLNIIFNLKRNTLYVCSFTAAAVFFVGLFLFGIALILLRAFFPTIMIIVTAIILAAGFLAVGIIFAKKAENINSPDEIMQRLYAYLDRVFKNCSATDDVIKYREALASMLERYAADACERGMSADKAYMYCIDKLGDYADDIDKISTPFLSKLTGIPEKIIALIGALCAIVFTDMFYISGCANKAYNEVTPVIAVAFPVFIVAILIGSVIVCVKKRYYKKLFLNLACAFIVAGAITAFFINLNASPDKATAKDLVVSYVLFSLGAAALVAEIVFIARKKIAAKIQKRGDENAE